MLNVVLLVWRKLNHKFPIITVEVQQASIKLLSSTSAASLLDSKTGVNCSVLAEQKTR
jgi:hypothetical protein